MNCSHWLTTLCVDLAADIRVVHSARIRAPVLGLQNVDGVVDPRADERVRRGREGERHFWPRLGDEADRRDICSYSSFRRYHAISVQDHAQTTDLQPAKGFSVLDASDRIGGELLSRMLQSEIVVQELNVSSSLFNSSLSSLT